MNSHELDHFIFLQPDFWWPIDVSSSAPPSLGTRAKSLASCGCKDWMLNASGYLYNPMSPTSISLDIDGYSIWMHMIDLIIQWCLMIYVYISFYIQVLILAMENGQDLDMLMICSPLKGEKKLAGSHGSLKTNVGKCLMTIATVYRPFRPLKSQPLAHLFWEKADRWTYADISHMCPKIGEVPPK